MILPIKKQVTSLERSKRIKELGFPQNSCQWYWVDDGENVVLELKHDGVFLNLNSMESSDDDYYKRNEICIYAAPTVAEWGKILPDYINRKQLGYNKIGEVWFARLPQTTMDSANREADSRAGLWEDLKIKKLLEVKK